MKYKYVILLFFIFLISSTSFAQNWWNSDILEMTTQELLETKRWILDTCKFNRKDISVPNINSAGAIAEVATMLKKHKELDVKLVVMMNTTYDTISTHWLRTKSIDLKRSLIYFAVNPLRFEVKDSVITNFDLSKNKEVASRKIIIEITQKVDYLPVLNKLNKSYANKDYQAVRNLLVGLTNRSKQQQYQLPKALNLYKIALLLPTFYQQHYKKNHLKKHPVFPLIYPIEIGTVVRHINQETYDEEMDITFPAMDYISVQPTTSYKVYYTYNPSNKSIIYQSEVLRRAIQEFLEYEFSFTLDSMSNIPSNITPKSSTKQKFKFLSTLIRPKNDYVIRGSCNGLRFWNHYWVLQEPYTIKNISIDEKEQKAYISYDNYSRKEETAIYQLTNEQWIYQDTIKEEQGILLWKKAFLFLGILSLLSWLLILPFRYFTVFNNQINRPNI